jgi:hypothetical protein
LEAAIAAKRRKTQDRHARSTKRAYDAKNALDAARKRKLDTGPYRVALCDAQTAERCAIAALESHKKATQVLGRRLAAISFLGVAALFRHYRQVDKPNETE